MYRFHPQWQKTKSLIADGKIGELQSIHSIFSFFNDNPDDIRNKPTMGGGGLMDIGCYCISVARFLFESEPDSVYGEVDINPDFGVDTKASGILTFGRKTSTFTCSTLMHHFQRVTVFGTKGMIELDIPFNPDPDKPAQVHLITGDDSEIFQIELANHYVLQADAFCNAIINNTSVPTPLEDAVSNMKVIDAMFESGKENQIIHL
jgi:predicted dehydrogenase